MKFAKHVALLVLTLTLASCQEYGPVSTTLEFTQSLSLKAKREWVDIAPGARVEAVATLKKDKVYLRFGEAEVVFKGAKFDKDEGTFEIPFAKSGQTTREGERIGAFFRRSLRCDPTCERSEVFEETQTCTYYERRPVRRCQRDRRGNSRCETYWEEYPARGWQRVEIVETYRDYLVRGEISGERRGILGAGEGVYATLERDVRAISSCR